MLEIVVETDKKFYSNFKFCIYVIQNKYEQDSSYFTSYNI